MVITVDVDRETDQRLAELSARTGKSKAEHAAEILKYKSAEYTALFAPRIAPPQPLP